MNWFDVDKAGLAKLLADWGVVRVLWELIANALDTSAKSVVVSLTKERGSPKATVEVIDDDPDGFHNLAHAWTLFAESERKGDSGKRGRFNLGEKLVLACCYDAEITSTTGGVRFDAEGRHTLRNRREKGSMFRGTLRMTQEEYDKACVEIRRLIVPEGVSLTFNGQKLEPRKPLRVTRAQLPTVLSDSEGYLRRTARNTEVRVYEPREGETPSIYELGIPVVETGDRWHVDVQQKVPLNMDRDNVTPAYLRDIRTLVVNLMHDQLKEEQANTALVNAALEDENASAEAVNRALTLKFGEKRAIFDPSDPEANNNLIAQGYKLIYGPQLTSDQWKNVKQHSAATAAGVIAPTRKAEFGAGKDSWVDEDDYTGGMRLVVRYSRELASRLLGKPISVRILKDAQQYWRACFGDIGLVFNMAKTGRDFFEHGITDELNSLLIHEFAHDECSNHLDDAYHRACCRLGAKLARLALEEPGFFRR